MATSLASGTQPYKLGSPPDFGTLYSGRALDFDGVADYVDTGSDVNITGAFTVSAWAKTSDAGTSMYIGGKDASNEGWVFRKNTGNDFLFRVEETVGNTTDNATSSTGYNDGNWHHFVGVFTADGSTGCKIYVDGKDDTTHSGSNLSTMTNPSVNLFIGRTSSSTSSGFWDGGITNFQIWDKAWSLSDVQYAYTHPEKLITDNSSVTSGTTISNLKAWYPCTEGNPRSPQTTVYDGSPKELGSEIIGDGGFESGTDSWNYTNTTISQSTDYVKSGTYSLKAVQSGVSSDRAYKTFTTVAGKIYKFSFDTYKPSSGQDVAYIMRVATASDHNTPVSETISTLDAWVNTTGYVTATQTTLNIVAIPHNDSAGNDTVYIDNVSVKEVKMGNHGTTTFLGDELITNGDMELDANWANYAGDGDNPTANVRSTTQEHGGTYSRGVTTTDDYAGIYQAITTISGSVYRASAWIYGDATNKIAFQARGSSLDHYLGASGVVAGDVYSASWTKVEGDFTADSVSTNIRFFAGDGEDDTFTWYIDDVSVKEVGVATGWTTADAEPLIPQTALMGMSKPMVFNGIDEYVALGSQAASSASLTTISAWISIENFRDTTCGIMRWGKTILKATASTITYIPDTDGGTTLSVSHALTKKKLYHMVVVRDGDDKGHLYLNGALIETDTSLAAIDTGSESSLIGSDGSDNYFDGIINEFSIWDVAFTLAQVQELFNDGVALSALEHSVYTGTAGSLDGYWRNDGLGTWSDRQTAVTANDGTPTNASDTILLPEGTTTGKDILGFPLTHTNNGWLNLSGLEYVKCGESSVLNIEQGLTLEAWIKTTGADGYIIGRDDNSVRAYYFAVISGKTRLYLNDGSSESFDDGATSVNDGNWHYVAGVFVPSTSITIYVDGSSDGTHTSSIISGASSSNEEVYIGTKGNLDSNKIFEGQIDEAKIYNRALTSTEITKNYNHGKSKHSN